VDLGLAGGSDGRDVIRRLRQERPGMPAVVVTGYNPLAPKADLRGLGGPTLRLGKPIECDALLEHLASVLDGSAALATPRRRLSDTQPMQAAA
jgi:ActR/RegA family two-component response regulator